MSFNFCKLPMVPLERVVAKLSPHELFVLTALTNHQFYKETKEISVSIFEESVAMYMDGHIYSWRTKNPVSTALDNLEKLSKIYKLTLDVVSINPKHVALLENRISFVCRTLEISGTAESGNAEAISRMLKNAEMKSLYLNVINCNVTDNSIFTVDQLFFASADWMMPSDLLRFENRQLQVVSETLTEETINAFIKKWIAGGNNNLEVAFISRENLELDMDLVMDAIHSIPFDAANRDRFYFPVGTNVPQSIANYSDETLMLDELEFGVNLENAIDIKKADGTWASIQMDLSNKQLRMFVWNNRHPTQFVLQELIIQKQGLEESLKNKKEYLVKDTESANERHAIMEDLHQLEQRLAENAEKMATLTNSNV